MYSIGVSDSDTARDEISPQTPANPVQDADEVLCHSRYSSLILWALQS